MSATDEEDLLSDAEDNNTDEEDIDNDINDNSNDEVVDTDADLLSEDNNDVEDDNNFNEEDLLDADNDNADDEATDENNDNYENDDEDNEDELDDATETDDADLLSDNEAISNIVEKVSNNGRGFNNSYSKSNHRSHHTSENNNYSNDNYISKSANYQSNHDARISKATENGVKKSITELIENVKNQVLAEQKDRNNRVKSGLVVGSKTIDQFLYDLVRPKIVEYLDAHLEDMVQDIVEKEIKKIVSDVKD